MTKQQNRTLHALLGALDMMRNKKDIIGSATGGRSTSSKDLSQSEAKLLITTLHQEQQRRTGATKAKIIHYCCEYFGMTTADDKPDYTRINKWVRGIGSNNPNKKQLGALNAKEMNAVCTQVETAVKKKLNG